VKKNRPNGGQMDIRMEIMGLSNQLRRYADAVTARYGGKRFTGMQSFIIAYLYDRASEGVDVFQKDIEREFYIGRSTASGILSLMEKNGLVTRIGVPQDARLKKLGLTPKAEQICCAIRTDLDRMDDRFDTALTPEEQGQMRHCLNKLWKAVEEGALNLGLEPKKRPSPVEESMEELSAELPPCPEP
jgi:DNA-binding MarR family transcriptional regulator